MKVEAKRNDKVRANDSGKSRPVIPRESVLGNFNPEFEAAHASLIAASLPIKNILLRTRDENHALMDKVSAMKEDQSPERIGYSNTLSKLTEQKQSIYAEIQALEAKVRECNAAIARFKSSIENEKQQYKIQGPVQRMIEENRKIMETRRLSRQEEIMTLRRIEAGEKFAKSTQHAEKQVESYRNQEKLLKEEIFAQKTLLKEVIGNIETTAAALKKCVSKDQKPIKEMNKLRDQIKENIGIIEDCRQKLAVFQEKFQIAAEKQHKWLQSEENLKAKLIEKKAIIENIAALKKERSQLADISTSEKIERIQRCINHFDKIIKENTPEESVAKTSEKTAEKIPEGYIVYSGKTVHSPIKSGLKNHKSKKNQRKIHMPNWLTVNLLEEVIVAPTSIEGVSSARDILVNRQKDLKEKLETYNQQCSEKLAKLSKDIESNEAKLKEYDN